MAGFAKPSDRAKAYAVFGGTPRYLEAIDSARPLADNIVTLYDIVAPLESALATQDPAGIWRGLVEPRFHAYLGHLFETIVEEGYYRLQAPFGLPVVKEWGRWEGLDRGRRPVEIDIASELADGRMMTGAVKWNRAKLDVQVHLEHLDMLSRLASAGVGWAHRALEPGSALIYVASNGFTDRFRKAAEASRGEVYLWSLGDLYQEITGG
jgi:hypothetical protein